jgi:Cu-Zn family superoxide dismutase
MKHLFSAIILFIIVFFFSCKPNKNTEKNIEIKMETFDSITKAIIVSSENRNGIKSEKIKIIEGSEKEVMKKIKELGLYNNIIQSRSIKKLKKIKFNLSPKSNSNASGTVTFIENNMSVNLEAKVSGLSPGIHAIHIHEKADCSSDDGKSSGGHWNPTFQNHGSWGSDDGFHRGDIGNLIVNSNGDGEITFSTDLWCLDCEDSNKNITGKAIIIHEGEDDFKSQPSGAAGARVSCSAIIY